MAPSERPTLVARDVRALAHVLRAPNQLGLGRAWVAGALELEGDLEQALAACASLEGLKFSALDRLRAAACLWRIAGRDALRSPPAATAKARPRGRRHSLRRDRDAVRHHYDAPAGFYRLVHGPSLVYSCAYFASRDEPLERAQERKLELTCRTLRLRPGAGCSTSAAAGVRWLSTPPFTTECRRSV